MTDYLENSTPINVIPDYVENFAEASMYVMESVDDDFFAVLESAGFVDENGAITESTEVVTEGVKELADKFIGALKSLWEKIQGWFQKVAKWFEDQKKKVEYHIKKILDKVKGATIDKITLEGVPQDKKIGSFTEYNIPTEQIVKAYKGVSNAVARIKIGVQAGENGLQEVPFAKEEIEEALGGTNVKEIAAGVKKAMVVNTTENATAGYLKGKRLETIKSVIWGNTDKKTLSEAYTTQKKAIDGAIKKINEMKSHKIFKDADQKAGNASLAKAAAFCKTANQALHAYHSAVVGLLRARFVQYAHLLSVCATATIGAKAKAKMKKTNESTDLASLMEW